VTQLEPRRVPLSETAYIRATNLAKLRGARLAVTDVLVGVEFGVDEIDFKGLHAILARLISAADDSIDVSPDEDQ
jgi:hypothetical protein